MSDWTEEQKAANQAFEDALNSISHAYAADAGVPPGIVLDHITIYTVRSYDDDGDPVTSYGIQWPADSRTSHYAALGLLEYAREKIKQRLFGAECSCGEDE